MLARELSDSPKTDSILAVTLSTCQLRRFMADLRENSDTDEAEEDEGEVAELFVTYSNDWLACRKTCLRWRGALFTMAAASLLLDCSFRIGLDLTTSSLGIAELEELLDICDTPWEGETVAGVTSGVMSGDWGSSVSKRVASSVSKGVESDATYSIFNNNNNNNNNKKKK